MIHLVDIDPNIGTWRLEVDALQKNYVADVVTILGRAYVHRKYRSRAFWIYQEDQAVGIGLYYDCPERNSFDLSQLFIDKRYQRHGYGKAAVGLILEEMRRDGKYSKVIMCYVEGNDASCAFFKKLGFVEIFRECDEIYMEMNLQ